MTAIDYEIIRLINKGYSCNDIINYLQIPAYELWRIIENFKKYNVFFKRKFYADGEMFYMSSQIPLIPNNEVSIITEDGTTELVVLLMSDLHLGKDGTRSINNRGERLDLIAKCKEYCKANNIHIIFNGGDFIDGIFDNEQYISDLVSYQKNQINHALEVYPYDPNILTFTCLGNHDLSSLLKCNIDFAQELIDRRHDIIPVGYGSVKIRVKNDAFAIYHKLNNGTSPIFFKDVNTFYLKGHSHLMRYNFLNSTPTIFIPALVEFEEQENYIHSVLKMTLIFNRGYIKTAYFEQLLIEHDFQTISQAAIEINPNRKINSNENIMLEEPFTRIRH